VEKDDIFWLEASGFARIGRWAQPDRKLQRDVSLKPIAAIYAFVVSERLCYLGKASSSRSRIRSYNRSLTPLSLRKLREVHCRIQETWNACHPVDVWLCKFNPECGETLGGLEARWIKERRPLWNRT
jgi:hypothetical protein